MGRKNLEPTKEELITILSEYYGEPKSFYRQHPKDALIYLYDEEVLPDLRESNMREVE